MSTVFQRGLRVVAVCLASFGGLCVVICCGWFVTMELLLRHGGYGWRFMVAAAIVAVR